MAGLIILEGIDGCGKSTVAKRLAEAIGGNVVLTREPTDSWMGRAVKDGDGKEVSPYTDALLFMTDRAYHVAEMVEEIKKGKLIICDRYYHSTVAYQAASLRRKGLGDNFDWLLDANTRIAIKPDATYILRVPVDVALKRMSDRPEKSRFEKAEFLQEVSANYDRLASMDSTIVMIDATKDPDEVLEQILSDIKERNI
ncbi:MAG: dTMP kinase [Candidatus Thermoplasmatota archaeon]|nr:dTMP kinase [Candidatus Thermoplasmatota archaeon]